MHKITQKSIKDIISQESQNCDVLDVELIIAHILKKDRIFVITHSETSISSTDYQKIIKLCNKRSQGYPLAYILKTKEFFGRNFEVTPETLIPRPETELMIEKVLSFIKQNKYQNSIICDIGTGSGIIAITLAKELQNLNFNGIIYASDISDKALQIAKQNALNHNVTNYCLFHNSNLLANPKLINNLTQKTTQPLIIVANLPYVDINTKEHLLLQPESSSLKFEPPQALWSKKNGCAHYEKLIRQTLSLNRPVASFYEIDPTQVHQLQTFLSQITHQTISINIYKDLANKERIFYWSIPTKT
jgi:release factor glutamine methyltransferase